MKTDVLKKSGKAILLGNEAIARGALEAGMGLGAAYPGTPSSEIGMTLAKVAKDVGVYFEFATNEKVAAEVAAGAAFSGVKSLVCFKHFGYNVASDSIFPLPYHGVKAGMVIVCADDPGCHSSGQSEQDSRYFSRMSHMPLLEPADPQECKDFVKVAYKLSEKLEIPVVIRITTRVSHAGGVVKLDPIPKAVTKGKYDQGKATRNLPPEIMDIHHELDVKLSKVHDLMKNEKLNFIEDGKGKVGVIANGVAYHYVKESFKELDVNLPLLKLGLTWPFPEEIVKKFLKGLDTVLVVEELEPVMETEIKAIAKEVNPKIKVCGKDKIPGFCELRQEIVTDILGGILKKKFKKVGKIQQKLPTFCADCKIKLDIPKRLPTFCPGCSHRATFWEVKQVVPRETPFGGDIGCYLLGLYPPYNASDFIISMGAASGVCHGMTKVVDHKPVVFVGDSTFFHAGMPGLVNSVFNKGDMVTVCLDNRWTAMTGHQPNPGTGQTAMGDETKSLKIEDVGKGLGVDHVYVMNAYNIKDSIAKMKEAHSQKGSVLVVSKGECRLQFMRRARHKGIKIPVFKIDKDKCTKCGTCLEQFGCPAIQKNEKGEYFIDASNCWGCSACSQVCPSGAIHIKK